MTGLPAVLEVLGAVLLEVLELTGCSASKTGILGDQLLRLYQTVSGNPTRVDQRLFWEISHQNKESTSNLGGLVLSHLSKTEFNTEFTDKAMTIDGVVLKTFT